MNDLLKMFNNLDNKMKVLVLLVLIFVITFVLKMLVDLNTNYVEGLSNTTQSGGGDNYKFVFFKMDSCGHCQKLQPEWDKLKKWYSQQGGNLELLEVSPDDELTRQHNVSSYPTLILLKNDEKEKEFNGRTFEKLKDFIEPYSNI
jgi:thioredoxin-related protein